MLLLQTAMLGWRSSSLPCYFHEFLPLLLKSPASGLRFLYPGEPQDPKIPKNARIADALGEIGPSVMIGAATTFLGIMPLAFASNVIFRVFFKMFLVIISFGVRKRERENKPSRIIKTMFVVGNTSCAEANVNVTDSRTESSRWRSCHLSPFAPHLHVAHLCYHHRLPDALVLPWRGVYPCGIVSYA